MKRFWKTVSIEAQPNGYGLTLDGRPVRTPARAVLLVPGATLAEAVAAEWQAVTDKLDPAAMPLTGLCNAAQDLITPDPAAHARRLAAFAAHDLLCYRAEGPEKLIHRQHEHWTPVLDWAAHVHGWRFHVTAGLMPITQPPETLAAITTALQARSATALAAHAQLIPLSGSALLAIALDEGHLSPEAAWAAADLEDAFQAEHWGEDEDALAMRQHRQQAFMAAAYCLTLSKA